MKWYLKVLKQYVDFSGRARRKELWMFVLLNMIFSNAILLRFHDIGKSGWNYFVGLIPLVGVIILLVWFCKDSQSDENKWGTNPKE